MVEARYHEARRIEAKQRGSFLGAGQRAQTSGAIERVCRVGTEAAQPKHQRLVGSKVLCVDVSSEVVRQVRLIVARERAGDVRPQCGVISWHSRHVRSNSQIARRIRAVLLLVGLHRQVDAAGFDVDAGLLGRVQALHDGHARQAGQDGDDRGPRLAIRQGEGRGGLGRNPWGPGRGHGREEKGTGTGTGRGKSRGGPKKSVLSFLRSPPPLFLFPPSPPPPLLQHKRRAPPMRINRARPRAPPRPRPRG